MLPRKTVIWLVSIRLPVRLFPWESRNSQRCSVSFRTQMVNQRGLTFRDSAKAIRNLNEQQKTGIAAAKALAAAGLHVEVYASTEAERKAGKPNGIYRKADGSIAIDLNAGDNGQGAVAYALAHETTHFIQDYSPAKFETYAELIIAAAESKGTSYDSLLARQLARLSEMEEYKNLSETELQDIAYDETIAEMSETILTDTDAANRLSQQIYKQDRTLWQKIKDFFTGLVEKLRNAYKDSDPDSDIGRMLKRAVQDNAEIAQAWAEAVREAGENYQLQDGQKNNARGGERYSDRASKYSYEYFTEKADMPVTAVDEMQNRDRESIIQAALRNAKEVGRTNENGNALVYVNDIGRDVLVGKKALAHGLDRRASTQAPVLAKIGDVLKNAVKVNELNPRSESIKESYVLVGAARSEMGLYVASFVVNQHSNEITSIDVLYAANAKKEPAALLPKITEKSATPTGSKLSIAKLLDIVNELYPDILPEEVLKHYGHTERPAGKIGESALYSSRNARDSEENQTETENFKKWFGDWQNDPAKASKVVNADGTPKVLYHQTSADFTIFEPRHEGAGTRDQDTPFGIFMKSSDRNIGVKGEKQMALYARIVNPLRVTDRADLMYQLKKISPEYEKVSAELRSLNDAYQQKHEDAKKAFADYIVKWRQENPNASRTAIYDDAGFNEVYEAEDNVLDEWETEARKVELRSKEAITRDLEKQGYDGVIIQTDKGSFGRSTDAYIALHPEQVKSATDNVGTFDKSNPDIRYSDRNSQSRQVERLEKKNAELRAEAEYLKQVVKVQKSGNKAHILDRSSVNAIGEGLMESVNAKGSEFGKLLNDFYRALGTEDMEYDAMQDRAGELAEWLLEHHQAERDGYAQEVLDFLKKRRVSLTESQIGDAEYTYGSLSEFKKAIKGSIILDQNSTTSLDQLWQEAAARFPDRFGTDTTEADMPT